MRSILLVFLCLLLFDEAISQQAKNVTLDLRTKKWFVENDIKKEPLSLTEIPAVLSIIFPEDNFMNYQIQINGDSPNNKIFIGLQCTDKSCIQMQLSDIDSQTVRIKFAGGYLVGINNRLLDSPRKIELEKGKLLIEIIDTAKNPSEASKVTVVDNSQPTKFCDTIPAETQVIIDLDQARKKYHFLCTRDSERKIDNCCGTEILSGYDLKYMNSCFDPKGHALTSTYFLVIDERPKDMRKYNESFKIFQLRQNQGYENLRILKKFKPLAKREISIFIIGQVDTTYEVNLTSTQKFMEDRGNFLQALQPKEQPKEDSSAGKEKANADALHPSPPDPHALTEYKGKLVDLKADLTQFNEVQFPDIDFKETKYKYELLCMQENIKLIFKFSEIPNSGKQLAGLLAKQVRGLGVPPKHYQDFCQAIAAIDAEYEKAISKKVKFLLSHKQIRVPNEDEFELLINTDKNREVLKRSYQSSGGFKIDFSTGIFHSGLSASDFVTSSQFFRYKDTRDTILASGQDSIIYTVTDTSVTVIKKNTKTSFGTGIYIHFYPRTGGPVNLGGSAGIILDNNGQVQYLLGGSLMFSVGNNRIALVGGYARGKEKTLSSENNQYYWKGGNTTLNSKYDLPKNYTGTNPTTYDRMKSSWFIGLTFNFASATVPKK